MSPKCVESSCVLSLRVTKSDQLSRIGLTVVFEEYTGTSFINLKTLNQREYENGNAIKFTRTILPGFICCIGQYKIGHIYFAYVANVKKYFRTSYPFGNYRIYHTPLMREVYAGY